MLVVAADDGPRAQTLEHLALLDALGIRHGLAVVTKADVVGPERTGGGRRRASRGCSRARRSPARRSSPCRRWTATGSRRCGPRSSTCVTRRSGAPVRGRRRIARRRAGSPPRHRPRLRGQGPRRRRDRHAPWRGRWSAARPCGSCRATGRSGSARSRSTARPWMRAEPGRTALNLAGVDAGRPAPRARPDRRPVGRGQRPAPRRACAAPLPDRARARLHLGTAAVEASVGRSGRDALDLPDGTAARDPAAGRSDRGRAGRPARPAAVVRRGPDRRGHRARRRCRHAGSRAAVRRSSGSGGSRRRSRTGDRAAIAAARLDLHGALEPARRPRRDRPGRSRRGRARRSLEAVDACHDA